MMEMNGSVSEAIDFQQNIDMENSPIVEKYKELICSEDFENALNEGVAKHNEITGTLKSRNKDNYEIFYDIMLKSRSDIQSILEKKKKDRTAAEQEEVKKFNLKTKNQYKFVKDMIFINENESMDSEGVSNHLPKKLVQIIDKLNAVVAVMSYIGHTELEKELEKCGIVLKYKTLEEISDVFQNEYVKEDVVNVFNSSCRIQKEIDDKKTEISEVIFENSVAPELRYDKDINPSGIKQSDFGKLVSIKAKIEKAKTEDSKAKAEETANNMSEEKTFDITRSEILRAKYMEMTESAEENI
jgi:hypothetical protein